MPNGVGLEEFRERMTGMAMESIGQIETTPLSIPEDRSMELQGIVSSDAFFSEEQLALQDNEEDFRDINIKKIIAIYGEEEISNMRDYLIRKKLEDWSSKTFFDIATEDCPGRYYGETECDVNPYDCSDECYICVTKAIQSCKDYHTGIGLKIDL